MEDLIPVATLEKKLLNASAMPLVLVNLMLSSIRVDGNVRYTTFQRNY